MARMVQAYHQQLQTATLQTSEMFDKKRHPQFGSDTKQRHRTGPVDCQHHYDAMVLIVR